MIVELTTAEALAACSVAVLRHMESLGNRRADAHGLTGGDGLALHIAGAGGELAAAKALGVYGGLTVNGFKDADLGQRIQVRTRSRSDYDLIVRDDDDDRSAFVLVVGVVPTFRVVGWMQGGDARRPEWRKNWGGRASAFFVPQSELRPIAELIGDSRCKSNSLTEWETIWP